MKKHTPHNKSYTIQFIPSGIGKTFYFKLNRFFISSIFLFIFVVFVTSIFYSVYGAKISANIQLVDTVKKENDRLKSENEKLYLAISKLKRIEKTSEYLRRLAQTLGNEQSGVELPSFDRENIEMDSLKTSVQEIVDEEFSSESNYSDVENSIVTSIPNISPVDGWITKRFGDKEQNGKGSHPGLDFVAKEGSLIRATAPGIVSEAISDKYLGLVVSIDHGGGIITRYGHCRQIIVKTGEIVNRGQSIALLGNTGNSTAPHVHYEIIKNGISIDPMKYIFDRID